MKFRLLGQWWSLRFVRDLKDAAGDADNTKREIRVVEGLVDEEALRVLIHECLHAADWWKDEEWVDKVSRSIAKLLLRLGWRRA